MPKGFVQPGEVLNLTAPYDVAVNDGALIGGTIFGIARNTYLSGDVNAEFQLTGVWDIAKVSAQAWTVGQTIYWDNSAKLATTTPATVKIGVATRAEANPTATGRVRLNGTPGSDFGS